MSNALGKRLQGLEARALSEQSNRLFILINKIVSPGRRTRPRSRIGVAGGPENVEFRPNPGEDDAAFLNRVQRVELPKLDPARKVWSLLCWSDDEEDGAKP